MAFARGGRGGGGAAWLARIVLVLWIAACASAGRDHGFEHVVERGETLYSIARRYGVAVDVLQRVNDLDDPSRLAAGQRLWIPGRDDDEQTVRGGAGSNGCRVDEGRRRAARQRALSESELRFAWPLHGGVSSCFGQRNGRPHEGLDILVAEGTEVHAAEAGKVVFTGWIGGYGNVVVIKHSGAYSTVYAHLDEIDAKKGQLVERGDEVAESGQTGRATGPHLHFEVRRSQRPEDPLLYLP